MCRVSTCQAELDLLLARTCDLLESPSQAVSDLGSEPAPRVAGMALPPSAPVLFHDRADDEPVRDGPGRVLGTESRLLFEALKSVFTVDQAGFPAVDWLLQGQQDRDRQHHPDHPPVPGTAGMLSASNLAH